MSTGFSSHTHEHESQGQKFSQFSHRSQAYLKHYNNLHYKKKKNTCIFNYQKQDSKNYCKRMKLANDDAKSFKLAFGAAGKAAQ